MEKPGKDGFAGEFEYFVACAKEMARLMVEAPQGQGDKVADSI